MEILGDNKKKKIYISYVPHGINSEVYKPTLVPPSFKEKIIGDKKFKFILFWMNRNIKRKQPSDVIWAFSKFVDSLPKKDKDGVCMIMHTNPVDKNGTDLFKVKEALAPNCNIFFSTNRVDQEQLNYLYNMSDCTINIAGNEGFGLTTAESVMAGTPVIVNVTGGLQDQCGFRLKDNDKELTADDYIKLQTLHNYREWENKLEWGSWVKPVWSRVQTVVGSIPTPYIIDDKVDVVEVAEAIKYWYDVSKEEREKRGKEGREWMLNEGGLSHFNMCEQMINGIDDTLEMWEPRKKYEVIKVN